MWMWWPVLGPDAALQVAVEVEAYKSSKSVAALKQIAGGLDDDVTASAEQLERQKAELQRLEAAVADKAAVLQKLSDEVTAAKQQEQVGNWQASRQLLCASSMRLALSDDVDLQQLLCE